MGLDHGDRPKLLIDNLAESTLDLDGAAPASDRELRNLRRRLHHFVWQRTRPTKSRQSPPTDSIELDAERAIAILLRVEVGR